jgi:hypothetical protein
MNLELMADFFIIALLTVIVAQLSLLRKTIREEAKETYEWLKAVAVTVAQPEKVRREIEKEEGR